MIAKVEMRNGSPALTVNGTPIAENAYITYFTDRARYGDFAQIGVSLFSVTLMFSSQPFSVTSGLPALHRGIFDTEPPDFAETDALIREILAACPQALILPRLDLALTRAWEDAHPDELLDFGFSGQRRSCFSSKAWLCETERLLRLYIRHVEESDYREHIIGFHLADGNTQEWFPFDERGGHGKRSREGFSLWAQERNLPQTEEAYYRYLSDTIADAVCALARVVKEETNRRLLAGTFYGYTFECPERLRGHHALAKVLNCPDVDFLSSPVSYAELRAPGIDEAYMVPIDSMILHGKLYLAENDARTHLTERPCDLPAFGAPIWKPRPKEEALESIRMMGARALTHGAGFWWFDMWGGWYRDADYLSLMRQFRELFDTAHECNRVNAAEIAVLADEESLAAFAEDDGTPGRIYSAFRVPLGAVGAPYAAYLASDYEAIKTKYRAFLLLEARKTETLTRIGQDCAARGVPCLRLSPETAPYTTAQYRVFLRESGLTLYTDRPAVVYVCTDYFYFYTVEEGEITVRFPRGKRAAALSADAPASFPAFLPKHRGFLYRLIDETQQ